MKRGWRVAWVPTERVRRYGQRNGVVPGVVLYADRACVVVAVLLHDGSPTVRTTEPHRLAPRGYTDAVDDIFGDTTWYTYPSKRMTPNIIAATRARFSECGREVEAPALGAGQRGFDSLHSDSSQRSAS